MILASEEDEVQDKFYLPGLFCALNLYTFICIHPVHALIHLCLCLVVLLSLTHTHTLVVIGQTVAFTTSLCILIRAEDDIDKQMGWREERVENNPGEESHKIRLHQVTVERQ